ncbi:MAG: GNAT family N-acetyltransferase [Alphaproteobacteria bacterium]|jgi:N-acyl-L-homoserine lactone synthetase|nr:GNAT family N-acetyltransferase [Alphaproteobacteria bacterium]
MNEKEVLFKVIATKSKDVENFLQKLVCECELTEKEEVLKEMLSLRYKIYIEELSWVEKNKFSNFEIEVDEFDSQDDIIHLGLFEGNEAVGYIRLLKHRYMINEISSFNKIIKSIKHIPQKREMESTRFCISSKADRLTSFSRILVGLITVCVMNGVVSITTLLESIVRLTAYRKGLPVLHTLGKGGINNLPVEIVSFSMSEDNLENIKSKNPKSLKDINSFKFEFFMDESVKFLSFKEIWQSIKGGK